MAINLLTHINANGANAQAGLCWYVFGFQANGDPNITTPINLKVNGVAQTMSFGQRIGTNDNPLVEFVDTNGIYHFIYGCELPFPPFVPCPCPGGGCSDQQYYSFDANGCSVGCNCVPVLTYDSNACELTYLSTGDCSGGSWGFQYSADGNMWTVIDSGSGNIPLTSHTPTQNGFYRVIYSPFGDCGQLASQVINVQCVNIPDCDCEALFVMQAGCELLYEVYGSDCGSRYWQVQYSSSGTGWQTVLSGTGDVQQGYLPTQNGYYRLVVPPSGVCSAIQPPDVYVNCAQVYPDICSAGCLSGSTANPDLDETYNGLNNGQTLYWKFGVAGILPDRLVIEIGSTVVLDTGNLTVGSSCQHGTSCNGVPNVCVADLAPNGASGGIFALPIPTGTAHVNVQNFFGGTCSVTGNAYNSNIAGTFSCYSNNVKETAYGSIHITSLLANKPIRVRVYGDPCGTGSTNWSLLLSCI